LKDLRNLWIYGTKNYSEVAITGNIYKGKGYSIKIWLILKKGFAKQKKTCGTQLLRLQEAALSRP
jgi:hypothetical protein